LLDGSRRGRATDHHGEQNRGKTLHCPLLAIGNRKSFRFPQSASKRETWWQGKDVCGLNNLLLAEHFEPASIAPISRLDGRVDE
jgi:hypothetical protein